MLGGVGSRKDDVLVRKTNRSSLTGVSNGAQAAEDVSEGDKAPDVCTGFASRGRQYLVERSDVEVALCLEIMAEARRNPDVRRIHQSIYSEVRDGLVGILKRAAERGQLRPDLDFEKIVTVLLALGDGIELRRAIDPSFSPESVIDVVLDLVRYALTDCAPAMSRPQEQSQ